MKIEAKVFHGEKRIEKNERKYVERALTEGHSKCRAEGAFFPEIF